MPSRYLTIQDCRSLMDFDPLAPRFLSELIRLSIKEKRTSFAIEKFREQHDHLRELELLKPEFEKFFALDYGMLPVCYALAIVAEEMMDQPVPPDPVAALGFANRFSEFIRQPKPRTYWYQGLERRFKAYVLLWLHDLHKVDITAFVQSVTEEMKDKNVDLQSIDITYAYVFPYLMDDTEIQYKAITGMLENARTKDSALNTIKDFGGINPIRAAALYEYAKSHDGVRYEGLFTHFLKGLYPIDGDHCVNEAIELHKQSYVECIMAISWLDYNDDKHIITVFDFTQQQTETTIEYLRILPSFYTRLIDNQYTPEEIKKECFRLIGELTTNEDSQLRGDLVWRTGMINGHDSEKMDLLPMFMAWGHLGFLNDYFSHFDSPSSLFSLLRQAFLEHGMSVDLNLFTRAVSGQYMLHQAQFSRELLKFLSDDLAIIRFAGVRIMMSRYGGSYEVNFLNLDEEGQLRVIESLLPTPTSIEQLMPLIMKLRNSLYSSVRARLESELITLIAAYDHHVVDMVGEHLDIKQEGDKKVLDNLNEAYKTFKLDKDARLKIKELDPMENELPSVELYYQLEHENQTEMMERINRQSFFAQLARKITMIRGSGFNTETNQDISLLGEVGTSKLIDRRYSINPDAYEWNFRMNAMEKNYDEGAGQ